MSWQKRLARNIRFSREYAGLSQAQLAKAMKVAVGTVSHWETGYRVPTVAHLVKMSAVLGEPLKYLLEVDQ